MFFVSGWVVEGCSSEVIKKIYGRDAGLDVIASLQETPAFAIPVVLQQLKQEGRSGSVHRGCGRCGGRLMQGTLRRV
jgi:hypothetical protein